MTPVPGLTPADLAALCARAFPERPDRSLENIVPVQSRQHEMVFFDLRWRGRSGSFVEPLIARRYISTISWWRPDDMGKAQREATVTRFLHQKGMPVSRVYAREFSARGDFLLFSRLSGVDWSALGRPFPEVVLDQADSFAWLLAKLHSLDVPDEVQSVVPVASLPAALANLTALALQIDHRELSQAVDLAMTRMFDVTESLPVLLHGDYHFSNVLIDEGKISGIVDWEYAAFGDPRWDVANAYMQMVDFDAADAADMFLAAHLQYSWRKFEGPPLYNVVSSLQQWAISEWIVRQSALGQSMEFDLARSLVAQRDAHERRARTSLRGLER